MRLPTVIAAALLVLAAPGSAVAASSGLFKVSASGKQSLSWTLDGTRGSCEITRGSGSGQVDLSFRSSSSPLLNVSKQSGITGSITTKVKGSRSGSYSETNQTPCPGFEPSPPHSAETTGCGEISTGIRLDFKTKGAFTWIVGPASPLPSGSCPAFGDHLLSSDLSACGDSTAQYKRSWGLAYSGLGMFATKPAISMKSLLKLKKGKKKTITARTRVDCKPASMLSSPITLTGEMKLSLVFKRVS